MSDPVYIAAGATRIQQWIARTPLLALSRGASRALAERTSAAHIDRLLGGDQIEAHRAPDAPDVDGVVILRVPTAGQSADATSQAVDQAVGWLRCHLAEELPGIEWRLWAHQAAGYVAAFDGASHASAVSHGRWHLLPAELELPFAAACEGCRAESAVRQTDELAGENQIGLGPDCLVRLSHTRGLNLKNLTFDDVARKGGLGPHGNAEFRTIGRRAAENHLATIAADGNHFGALFKRLAQLPATGYTDERGETTIQERISERMHAAASNAVDAAAGKAGDPAAPVPSSIKHVVGGDDILVSVGARHAWAYVNALLATFEAEVRGGISDILTAATSGGAIDQPTARELTDMAGRVSLGVGIAFANRKHPFAHCTEMAQDAMKDAKRVGRGAAAINWIDLTVESALPRGRGVLYERVVDDPKVAELPPSSRATLAALIREGWVHGDRPARLVARDQAVWNEVAQEIGNEVNAWCERTRTEPLLPETISEETLRDLERDLDRARWWPTTNQGA